MTRTPPRWRDTPVGGHKVRCACRFTVPLAASDESVRRIADALRHEGFERAPGPNDVIVLRRGSAVGDTLLNATGLSLMTSRLGPLSLQAVFVVDVTTVDEHTEIVVSLVVGDELAPTVADTVDAVIDELIASGIPVSGPGWTRSVDLPRESLGHPDTARERRLRR